MTTDTATKKLTSFTWEEVAQHNTPASAYVAVRGEVYDLTRFAERHPGGLDAILFSAGRDCTTVFETYHALGSVDMVLKKYHIGHLTTHELPVFPEPTEFHRVVRARIAQYFVDTGKDPKGSRSFVWFLYLSIYATIGLSWYAQYWMPWVSRHLWTQVLCALVLGMACAQLGMHVLHDSSHLAISHSFWGRRLLGASADCLNGSSHVVWFYQHILGHHPYTNIAGADPDIATNEPSDIRRIKPSQTWYSHYIGQHLWVPLIYGVLALKTRLQDISIVYHLGTNDNIRLNPLGPWHTAIFWFGKAFFLTYRIIIPYLLTDISLPRFLLLLSIADAVSSYWLAITFQANHVVEGVEWPLPEGPMKLVPVPGWAEMQLMTTQDYAHDSAFWTLATGSLNYQAVHHLCPDILQHHYPALAHIVKATCAEYDVPFLYRDTFSDAFWGHISHLKVLGKKGHAE